MGNDDIRKELNQRIMQRFKDVKKTPGSYEYRIKSRSKVEILINFSTDIFYVWHNGIQTIHKPLAAMKIDEIMQYLVYKANN